ncbi:hypothetical protein [Myxosarcina sp. GI1(2024)]
MEGLRSYIEYQITSRFPQAKILYWT